MYVDMIICYDYAQQGLTSVDLKALELSRVYDLYMVSNEICIFLLCGSFVIIKFLLVHTLSSKLWYINRFVLQALNWFQSMFRIKHINLSISHGNENIL